MAIAFDAVTAGSISYSTSPGTFSHTVTGSDTYLVVGVYDTGTSAPGNITGITYNGVAMTRLACTSSAFGTFAIWGLADPTDGANTVSIYFSTGTVYRPFASSYTGVDTTDG